MKGRYEIKDLTDPQTRGLRFTKLDRARAELARAVPANRFRIWDREWRTYVD